MDANTLTETLAGELKTLLGDGLLSAETAYDFPVFRVQKSDLYRTLQHLKEQCGYGFLTTLCGLHTPDEPGAEFGLMYQLHNLKDNLRIRVKISMPKEDLQVPSITGLWPAANWMERQEFDFFGLEFTGHPDLRRILNMDEMNYFPLRKEYPLEDGSRDDKKDQMFGR